MAKVPADIRSLARLHTDQAIRILAGILENGTIEANRIRAAEILLNRGWGMPTQPIAGDDQTPLIVEIIQRVREPKP